MCSLYHEKLGQVLIVNSWTEWINMYHIVFFVILYKTRNIGQINGTHKSDLKWSNICQLFGYYGHNR